MSVEPLSAEDARILKLETPLIAGHVAKVILLSPEGPQPTLPRLRSHVATRLEHAPRLRRRLGPAAPGAPTPVWVEDPGFDIAHHIRQRRAPRPLDRTALCGVVAELMEERLDRSRPLWSLDLIDGLDDGGTALVWRIHHALADGFATMRILSAVLWDEHGGAGPGSDGGPAAPALSARRGSARPRLGELAGALWRQLRPHGRPSVLAAPVTAARAVAFATSSLEAIRQIAKSAGAGVTVNDVVLCAVAGGLRGRLTDGRPLPEMGVKVPVSLHHAGEGDAAANRDSFMLVELDVTEPDPIRRLQAISRETDEGKRHHDAEVLDALWRELPGVAAPVGRALARWAMSPREFGLNVSNVRGPSEPLHVLGARVSAVYPLAEIAQRHALRVAALSLSGLLCFGLCADPTVVPAVDNIARAIERELGELQERLPATAAGAVA